MSRVALLEQKNVLRHQVFVVLNSHKISLFLCDLVNGIDVRFLFQYVVGLGLRGCYSNVRLGRANLHRTPINKIRFLLTISLPKFADGI